jgi:hypothetical protein
VRYLGRAVPDDGAFTRAALRAPDTPALLDLATRSLASRPAEAVDLGAHGHLGLERSGSVA